MDKIVERIREFYFIYRDRRGESEIQLNKNEGERNRKDERDTGKKDRRKKAGERHLEMKGKSGGKQE